MLFDALSDIIISNNFIEKSNESFWETFQKYQKEHCQEFNKIFVNYSSTNLTLTVNDVSFLAHNWPDHDYCCIVINSTIEYNNKIMGYYDVHYRLNGEVDDDFFVLY
ncbi:MAG: hypothetical protein Q4D32_09760 [Eubacteriales bacterium]|nr:hypothetical protein [Eubacteriales bacterium]